MTDDREAKEELRSTAETRQKKEAEMPITLGNNPMKSANQ